MKATAEPLARLAGAAHSAAGPIAYRDDRELSWAEFRRHVNGVSAELRRRPEPSWALCCEDAFYFLAGFFAALACGKRLIIPPNFQPGTLAALVGEADGWIADRDARAPDMPGVCVGVENHDAGEDTELGIAEGAVIDLYTSGTTGAPKRVRKHPNQLFAEVEVLEQLWGGQIAALPVIATVPHHHIYGLLFRLLWPVYAGRPFDVRPCSGPDELLQRLKVFNRVAIVSSPAQLSRWPELMNLHMLRPHAAVIFSSGGPLPATAAEAYGRALGRAPIEIYGSSETGGVGWRVQTGDAESQIWTPAPGVEVRVGAEHALEIRSPFVGGDDWFAMADGAELLVNGRFRLRGRLDRVVKIEEKRLSLPEMEGRLTAHPWVAQAGVVLLDGERRLLGVVVVLSAEGRGRLRDAGKRQTSGELRAFLAQYYEPALLPRRWRFPDTMPHNDRGKISAAALAALFSKSP
jgi:acyl-coenzyme A synthetase/AMP-(fatty) acid ligase